MPLEPRSDRLSAQLPTNEPLNFPRLLLEQDSGTTHTRDDSLVLIRTQALDRIQRTMAPSSSSSSSSPSSSSPSSSRSSSPSPRSRSSRRSPASSRLEPSPGGSRSRSRSSSSGSSSRSRNGRGLSLGRSVVSVGGLEVDGRSDLLRYLFERGDVESDDQSRRGRKGTSKKSGIDA
jgi:hypothetical protein